MANRAFRATVVSTEAGIGFGGKLNDDALPCETARNSRYTGPGGKRDPILSVRTTIASALREQAAHLDLAHEDLTNCFTQLQLNLLVSLQDNSGSLRAVNVSCVSVSGENMLLTLAALVRSLEKAVVIGTSFNPSRHFAACSRPVEFNCQKPRGFESSATELEVEGKPRCQARQIGPLQDGEHRHECVRKTRQT